MMPPKPVAGTPEEWLKHAQSSLAVARIPLPDGAMYGELCYQAQQAAEKAIKAVYQSREIQFRFTHDLEELFEGLARTGLEIPAEIRAADLLTPYGVETRYPGFYESVTEEDYEIAVKMAELVLAWAIDHISPNSK